MFFLECSIAMLFYFAVFLHFQQSPFNHCVYCPVDYSADLAAGPGSLAAGSSEPHA